MGCVPDCQPLAGNDDTTGTWCKAPEPPNTGYICSRLKGHTGPHMACNMSGDHDITRWEKEPMETERVLELLENVMNHLQETKDDYVLEALSKSDEAQDAANNARNSAEEAEDRAMEAKDFADTADDRLAEAINDISNLMDAIKAEDGEISTDKSLKADIAKWKLKVERGMKLGHDAPGIAKALNISEFLVQCIIDEVRRAA